MSQKKIESSRLHFRRCHCCGGVTEKEGETVLACDHCGKPMAPFYFFNEMEVVPLSEFEIRPESNPRKSGERTPVRGFTAYW